MEVNEITKLYQKECSLCQKYGNQRVIDGKYCTGFFNNKCEKCAIFIGTHPTYKIHIREERIYEFSYD